MASAKRFFSGSDEGDENENEKRRKKKHKVEKEKSKPQKTSIDNEEDLKAMLLLGSLWLSNHWSFKVNQLIRKIT